ncbi:hypothetical protein DPX16_6843 [Anabarilius grahami]|uniref:Transmembrane protein 176A n=1 Tax=Anabarilius grahami TaxID=495550 RepID=A0A3N0Y5G2_ANAGA|nr:hypothetical protein DPX16_6843 [Anabarilius grahami]
MIVGILNIVVGIMFTCLGLHWNTDIKTMGPFWLGSVLVTGMILNIVNAALAITAVALFSLDLANSHTGYYYDYSCDYSGYDHYIMPSPEEKRKTETCLYYKNLTEMVFRVIDIMMIVLLVLQLCVTISFCVLTGKALCKKDEEAKDPELYKQLLEDDTAVPAC